MTRIVAALLAIAGAAAAWAGWRYGLWSDGEPGAGLLPGAAGAAVAVFAGTEALSPGADAPPPQAVRRLLGHGAAILAFAPALEVVGTIPAILLLFVGTLRWVERLPWRVVVPVAAGAALGSWLVFERLLDVPLPRGLWWDA
ncbi:MAG: tripartite tricarboxylate transporter TctB family protein [Alphaproteobacteria bacterium]|nr:tripartite tricarboxylate transporter TctB family protein [Alphaproteobacteria bacterium]